MVKKHLAGSSQCFISPCTACMDVGDEPATKSGMTWKQVMGPVNERVNLDVVAAWYLNVWDWRTSELEAGRGTPYDYDPEYRVNRSVVRSKFPWLTLQDEIDLVPVIARLRKRHAATPPAKEKP
jgi:hypothetical protein